MATRAAQTEAGASVDFDLQPVGEAIFQPENKLKQQRIEGGQTLRGVDHPMTLWYHDDGSTSLLKTVLDDYYAKKPGFHKEPTAAWAEAQKNRMPCPVKNCGAPSIPIILSVDGDAMQALGFKMETDAETKKSIMLDHFRAFHPQTYAALRRSGQVPDTVARNLR